MGARGRRTNTAQERRGAVERWKQSGLTQAEFCRREGLAEWSLSTWKREFGVGQASGADVRAGCKVEGRKVSSKSPRNRAKYWRDLVDEQRASGLSAPQFCKERGVKIRSFNRWRQKLAAEGRSASLNQLATVNPFVAVHIPAPSPARAVESMIEILLPGGSTVRVTECTPLDLLSRVLRALEATC